MVLSSLRNAATSSKSSRSGFTLIELIIVIAIIAILSGLLLTAMLGGQRSLAITESKLITQDDIRSSMMIIIRELRQVQASSLPQGVVDQNLNELSYVIATDVNGNGWPLDGSGNPEFSPARTLSMATNEINGVEINQLVRTEVGNPDTILASNLGTTGTVSFTITGNTAIQVVVTGQDVTDNGDVITSTLTETVTPRN